MKFAGVLLMVFPLAQAAVAPSDAQSLTLAGAATTQFNWLPPASPNGPVVRYDLLRATGANAFASAVCVQSGLNATNASDAYAGSAFYLVRAVNQTGSTTGFDSQGSPITAPGCGTCGAELCNGYDDDCSGVIDDNLTAPANNCTQDSLCHGAAPVCCGAGGWLCSYPDVSPNIEVTGATTCLGGTHGGILAATESLCDGFDGNCNNQVDESFIRKGKACTAGLGSCQGTGTFVCAPSQTSTVCNAVANPFAARDEICNGFDDDCDGQVDERTPVAGSTCFDASGNNPHACKGWADPMAHITGAGNFWIYQYEASRPEANSGSAGVDPSRACANPGVKPWAYVDETAAAAACAAIRNSFGQPMRLCTAAEWQAACALGNAASSVWAFAANPTIYNTATCNGIDRGLGAAWTTGTGVSCYSNPAGATNGVVSSASVYDLSGNLAEWTSTPVVSAGTTFYAVNGGAYTTPSLGTGCKYNDFMLPPASPLPDVGFRCCSDNAP